MTTFEHWPQRAADWLAPYDNAKGAYPPEMNKTAYDRSLDVIRKLAERHRGDATVWGVEPVGGRATDQICVLINMFSAKHRRSGRWPGKKWEHDSSSCF